MSKREDYITGKHKKEDGLSDLLCWLKTIQAKHREIVNLKICDDGSGQITKDWHGEPETIEGTYFDNLGELRKMIEQA